MKYLNYVLDQNVFFDMIRNFINNFKNSSASFEDFLKMLLISVNPSDLQKLKNKVEDIDEYFLKSLCPPVFSYKLESDNNKKIKEFKIIRELMNEKDVNNGTTVTNVKFYFDDSTKPKTFFNIEISDNYKIVSELKDKETPAFVLLNFDDKSYLEQKFTDDQVEWINDNLNVNNLIKNIYFI